MSDRRGPENLLIVTARAASRCIKARKRKTESTEYHSCSNLRTLMAYNFSKLMFTPAMKALQEKHGSRRQYARFEDVASPDRFGPNEQRYIATRDSFYLASVAANGWPYVQHRGGPVGFLKALDPTTLAFADFRGNKQYVTEGNLATDNRVAMILMDYPSQSRLKILGRAELIEPDNNPE